MWLVDYVQINPYSRSGKKLTGVKGIVMHWTANYGATDTGHANFFDGADGGAYRYASAHLFVDKDSSTLIIPLDEVAYHSNDKPSKIAALGTNANLTTIGVELCVEKDGTIHPDTVTRAVYDVARLCKQFGLDAGDIYRHYDVTGKNCPAPWVAHPTGFTNFKSRVTAALNPAVYHIVKDGDTIWGISRQYNVSMDSIYKLNNLNSSSVIYIGQKLRIK